MFKKLHEKPNAVMPYDQNIEGARDVVYDVRDIDISYNLTKKIIKDLSFVVNQGDFLSILGPNGAGKSTLIKAMCRIHNPSKGSIIFESKLVHKENPFSFYFRYFSLHCKKLFFKFTNPSNIDSKNSKYVQQIQKLEASEKYKPTGLFEMIQVGLTFNKQKKQEWLEYYKDLRIKKLEKKIDSNDALMNIDELIKKEHDYYHENVKKEAYSSKELAKRLAYVPQILDFPKNIKVYDFVKLGRFPHAKLGMSQKQENEIIMEALETVEMADFSDVYLEDLSGGQQQRCLIAMALAQDTNTIVLDEPTNHLDIKSQLEIIDLLHRLNHQLNKTIILVIHDLNYSIRYANKLLVLKHGQSVAFGDCQQVITEELIKEVFEVNSKIGIDQNNRKFIEYSWLDQSSHNQVKRDQQELQELLKSVESIPVLSVEDQKALEKLNQELYDLAISHEEYNRLKNEILDHYSNN